MALDWITNSGFKFPFAGITFCPKDSGFISLKGLDYVNIELLKPLTTPLFFYIHFNIDNYTKRDDPTTSYIKRYQIEIDSQKLAINIPIKQMTTPEWWFSQNSKIIDFKPDKNKIIAFSIEDGNTEAYNKTKSLSINRIRIKNSIIVQYSKLFLYLIIIPIIIYGNRSLNLIKKRIKPDELLYLKNILDDSYSKDKGLLLEFLQKNYKDSDLSKQKVIKSIGLASDNISLILKTEFDCNFRDYLNKLRLDYAEKLLKETEMNITEISFETGFKIPSSFNRVFKKHFKESPRDMRKRYSKNN